MLFINKNPRPIRLPYDMFKTPPHDPNDPAQRARFFDKQLRLTVNPGETVDLIKSKCLPWRPVNQYDEPRKTALQQYCGAHMLTPVNPAEMTGYADDLPEVKAAQRKHMSPAQLAATRNVPVSDEAEALAQANAHKNSLPDGKVEEH